jgi:hypothetical protein
MSDDKTTSAKRSAIELRRARRHEATLERRKNKKKKLAPSQKSRKKLENYTKRSATDYGGLTRSEISSAARQRRREFLSLHVYGMTMAAIGQKYGITRSRVSALLARQRREEKVWARRQNEIKEKVRSGNWVCVDGLRWEAIPQIEFDDVMFDIDFEDDTMCGASGKMFWCLIMLRKDTWDKIKDPEQPIEVYIIDGNAREARSA